MMTPEKSKELKYLIKSLMEQKKVFEKHKSQNIDQFPVTELQKTFREIEKAFPDIIKPFNPEDFIPPEDKLFSAGLEFLGKHYRVNGILSFIGNAIARLQTEAEDSSPMNVAEESLGSFWRQLHPKITDIAKPRFEAGHYADSVEAALKEVNNTVKIIYKKETGNECDGADLMLNAFRISKSDSKPIILLADISTQSGRSIQEGYMFIFAGSMKGIRNPKAHENIDIDDKRATHFLYLASLLMYKINERISPKKLKEPLSKSGTK